MEFEKSCGAIVFTEENGQRKYVVIRSVGGDYGFPKGHMEPGESERETALREIWEETGLACTLVDGFRAQDAYPLPNKPGVRKQVVYFLAEYSGQEIRLQPEEISGAYLVPFSRALELLPFPEMKRILKEAHGYLTGI